MNRHHQIMQKMLYFQVLFWAVVWNGWTQGGILEIHDYGPRGTQQAAPVSQKKEKWKIDIQLVKATARLFKEIIATVDLTSPNLTEIVMGKLRNFDEPALHDFIAHNLPNISDSEAPEVLQMMANIVKHGKDQLSTSDLNHSAHEIRRCQETQMSIVFWTYIVPALFLVCFFGNVFNVAVYTMDYFKKFVAIKMLALKAVMNTLFVLCLLPKSFRIMGLWEPNQLAERVFWYSWPYVLTAMNTFGMCAMWLTVFMTLERYLYITLPTRSRRWVTNKNFYLCFAVLFLITVNLQSVYLYTRHLDAHWDPATNLRHHSNTASLKLPMFNLDSNN